MEREGRDKADHPLGHAFRCLCETVVSVERRIGELIEPPREPEYLTIPLHAAQGGRGHPLRAQFRQTRDAARFQHGMGHSALG